LFAALASADKTAEVIGPMITDSLFGK
jgi:hypothetical protein